MPKPKKGESEQDFISRCMAYDDMQKYDQKQRAAICYSYWRESKKENIMKPVSPRLKHFAQEIGKEITEDLKSKWQEAIKLAEEDYGVEIDQFDKEQWTYVKEAVKNMYGLKEKVSIQDFLDSDKPAKEFIHETVTSGDFASLWKGHIKPDTRSNEEVDIGDEIDKEVDKQLTQEAKKDGTEPDGTGPHGRGEGPGKGKADESGMKKDDDDEEKDDKKEESRNYIVESVLEVENGIAVQLVFENSSEKWIKFSNVKEAQNAGYGVTEDMIE
jgi:hypothetical protein